MEVIQIPLFEQRKPINRMRTRTFFILNEILDEEVLRNGLESLIQNHWRKLGSRLVLRRQDGLLEYHLPRTFEEKYMLFHWSSRNYEHKIDNISSLPKATPPGDGIALLPPLSSIESWFKPSDWPLNQTDDPPDAPLLYIHISTFTDATVIAISIPHVVSDQFGLVNIIKAWLGCTKSQPPPPMVGYNNDVLTNGKSYDSYRTEDIVRKGRLRVRRKMEYPVVVAGLIPDLVVHREEVSHLLFLPLPLLQSLRERHTKVLTDKYGTNPGISHGDIITGVVLKLSRMHKKSTQTVALTQTVNLRGRIPALDRDRDAFIHNSLQYATARFQIGPSTPLSEIAYQNRQAINQALDQEDIEIGQVIMNEMVRRGQRFMICEPLEKFYNVTNWSGAWKGLDFSSAIKGRSNDRAPPNLLVLGHSNLAGAPNRYTSTITCKSAEGYWCNFAVRLKTKTLIQEYLKKDPMLENL